MWSTLQVRDEIEHLLDDNEDMAQLYLTRKWLQNQQLEAHLGATTSNNHTNTAHAVRRLSSIRSGSLVTSNYGDDNDVEDLEMLLEAYFMQLDGTRNKILSVSMKYNQILVKSCHCQTLKIRAVVFYFYSIVVSDLTITHISFAYMSLSTNLVVTCDSYCRNNIELPFSILILLPYLI